jgi:hypothetical protein
LQNNNEKQTNNQNLPFSICIKSLKKQLCMLENPLTKHFEIFAFEYLQKLLSNSIEYFLIFFRVISDFGNKEPEKDKILSNNFPSNYKTENKSPSISLPINVWFHRLGLTPDFHFDNVSIIGFIRGS